MTYDSVAANPQPIIVFENTLSTSAAVPTKVSAQLDVQLERAHDLVLRHVARSTRAMSQQIALQATNATALGTNRYSYSAPGRRHRHDQHDQHVQRHDHAAQLLGQRLRRRLDAQGARADHPETGGVILDLGDEGRTLWFATSGSGGGYTAPAGDFNSLSKNAGTGVYTRTLTDGTQITFNSGGYETAVIDLQQPAHHLRL